MALKRVLGIVCVVAAALSSGCGGGGSPTIADAGLSNSASGTLYFDGTVAIGAALTNVVVSATCKGGTATSSSPTNALGKYSMGVGGSLPCSFSVIEPTTGFVLRSLTATDGTVNITPLTEAIYVFANGDTAKLVDANTKLATFMASIGSPLAGNPITQQFLANGTDLDKNILDLTKFTLNTTVGGTPVLGSDNPFIKLPEVLGLIRDNCASNASQCISNQAFVSKIIDPYIKEFVGALLSELDKQLFGSAFGALALKQFDEATKTWIEHGIKAAVAYVIEKAGPTVVQKVGKKVTTVQIAGAMANALAGDTNMFAFELNKANVAEFAASTLVSVAVDIIEKATMPTADSLTIDSALESAAWGAMSFALETASQTGVYCSFHMSICEKNPNLVLVAQELKSAFSWVYKDIVILVDAKTIENNSRLDELHAAATDRLVSRYNDLNDPQKSGAVLWATVAGMRTSWADEMGVLIRQAKADIPNLIGVGLEPISVTQLTRSQIQRLDRLLQKSVIQDAACRDWKANEKQVGVSKCLNLFGVSPPALLSCQPSLVLLNGACVNPTPVCTVHEELVNGQCISPSISAFSYPNNPVAGTPVLMKAAGQNLSSSSLVVTANSCTNFSYVSKTATEHTFYCTYAAAGTYPVSISTATGLSLGSNYSVTIGAASRYATVGSYPITDCVKDNTTGLIWEGKTTSGLRAGSNTYNNYELNVLAIFSNGGSQSYPTIAQVNAANNAVGYVTAVNAVGLCGFNSGWRLPTRDELVELRSAIGVRPNIDASWFPNTDSQLYWTACLSWDPWAVSFIDYYVYNTGGYNGLGIRLVR